MTHTYRTVSMHQDLFKAFKIHYLVPFSKQLFGVWLSFFSDGKTDAPRSGLIKAI